MAAILLLLSGWMGLAAALVRGLVVEGGWSGFLQTWMQAGFLTLALLVVVGFLRRRSAESGDAQHA